MFMVKERKEERQKSLNLQKSIKIKINIIHKPVTAVNILEYFLTAYITLFMRHSI